MKSLCEIGSSVELVNAFSKIYGNRVHRFITHDLKLNTNEIEAQGSQVEDIPISQYSDKCNACPASDCRQDLPFWRGGIQKQIMIVAQDAGKGLEIGRLAPVFEMHKWDKHLTRNTKKYHEIFTKIIGADFMDKIYVTDIVKCAYSTHSGITLQNLPPCTKDGFLAELTVVKPKLLITLGSPAHAIAQAILRQNNRELETVIVKTVQINKKSHIKLQLDQVLGSNECLKYVLRLPHVGNLHVGSEFSNAFIESLTTFIGSAKVIFDKDIYRVESFS